MIVKSQNIKGEIEIPSSFEDFEGFDGRAVKTFNGTPFAIQFGSELD